MIKLTTPGSAVRHTCEPAMLPTALRGPVSPPEPLVHIQNNFTEMILIMPFTKIAQKVPLDQTKGQPEL